MHAHDARSGRAHDLSHSQISTVQAHNIKYINIKKPLKEHKKKQRKEDPENQIDGFIGEGLPKGTRLWSKAGWMSQARHDAAWFCQPQGNPMLLVVFSHGRQSSHDTFLLPALARELIKIHATNN